MEKQRRYSVPFFGAYFFYYAGYCIFSSYIVLYLTEQQYSATLCGAITSLCMAANLLLEPVCGYITDTFMTTRRFLALSIGAITLLCLFCTRYAASPFLCVPALILTAGLAYPFSQLMDAWVNCCRPLDDRLVYSRIRAGGSIGFALTSILAGYYFRFFGWGSYFMVQAACFWVMLPFLHVLPSIELTNQKKAETHSLSITESFGVLASNRRFCLCLILCTCYWFSHRPVGSYLSLLVQARAGDASTFGNICGVGAVVEFFALMLLGMLQRRRPLPLFLIMLGGLVTNLARPLLILLLPGIWPLYLGQILQSLSFACYLSGSVECFTRTADPRIRSFCISMGLTVSSVAGTVLANLLGGSLCDLAGVAALPAFSLAVAAANLVFFLLNRRAIFE